MRHNCSLGTPDCSESSHNIVSNISISYNCSIYYALAIKSLTLLLGSSASTGGGYWALWLVSSVEDHSQLFPGQPKSSRLTQRCFLLHHPIRHSIQWLRFQYPCREIWGWDSEGQSLVFNWCQNQQHDAVVDLGSDKWWVLEVQDFL